MTEPAASTTPLAARAAGSALAREARETDAFLEEAAAEGIVVA